MNFAVTGGAGFIGSHIVRHLVSEGHGVAVIDDQSRGRLSNLDGIRDRVDLIKLDILDFDGLERALRGTDGIFHQAALTSVPESYEKKDEYHRVNVTGTENVFRVAMDLGIKVVYASSSSVYGDAGSLPIGEDSARRPANPYGVTKLEDEVLASKYSGSGAQIIGLRYFNVYGTGQTPDYAGVITKFLERISGGEPPVVLGDGMQTRDFVFVGDVARANLAAMAGKVGSGFFNVGTGKAVTIGELARLMIKISGRQMVPEYGDLRPGDVRFSTADTSLSKKVLGWQAQTLLEDGLRTLFR